MLEMQITYTSMVQLLCDNQQATSGTMMYKKNVSQHFKLKKEISECLIEIMTQQQFITNLYQWDAYDQGFPDTVGQCFVCHG